MMEDYRRYLTEEGHPQRVVDLERQIDRTEARVAELEVVEIRLKDCEKALECATLAFEITTDRADKAEARLQKLVEAVGYHVGNQDLDRFPRLQAALKAAKGSDREKLLS